MSAMSSFGVCKEEFYEKLQQYYNDKPAKKPFSKAKINSMIQELNVAKQKNGTKKERREYFLLRTYDVLTVEDQSYLIKKHNDSSQIEYVVAYEDLYDMLCDFHTNKTKHGGRVKLEVAINKQFCIPRPAMETFLLCCQICNKKKQNRKKLVTRPILTKDFNERGQVDLIDFQSTPDENYKWILNYQDHSTKFLFLRPLQSESTEEVASQLLSIFLLIGAPKILQSDKGREFCHNIIVKLKSLWPECLIVHGGPRHPESQGSVEKSYQDVELMIRAWMTDNNSNRWSFGLNFVQWQMNISFHGIIGASPYKALLGSDPKIGLASSNIPLSVAKDLTKEEELMDIFRNTEDLRCQSNSNLDILSGREVDFDDISIKHEPLSEDFEPSPMSEDNLSAPETGTCDPASTSTCCVCEQETTGESLCQVCKSSQEILFERIDSATKMQEAAAKMQDAAAIVKDAAAKMQDAAVKMQDAAAQMLNSPTKKSSSLK